MNARVVIAGGGTGGHLFPALAVADAVESIDPSAEVRFLGARAGIEARVLPALGRPVELLDVERVRGRGTPAAARAAFRLAAGARAARDVLRRFGAGAVLGVGGYASAAGVVGAVAAGIPAALHEQNAVPGWTNRLLGPLAERVFVGFAPAASHWWGAPVTVSGNPVRPSIARRRSRPARGEPFADGTVHLLVLGGSQGARFLNERAPQVAARLADALSGTELTLEVVHQVGRGRVESVEAAYADAAVRARVLPFIDDMGEVLSWADAALCRAGASTIAELAATGLPAVLVPFPHAASDHQRANARVLVEAGAAHLAAEDDWSDEAVAGVLAGWAAQPGALRRAAQAARSVARDDAAEAIARALLELASGTAAVSAGRETQ